MDRITFTTLHAYPGEVLYCSSIYFGKTDRSPLVAGAKIPNAKAEGGYDYFFIETHFGYGSHVFIDEWDTPAGERMRRVTLDQGLALMEEKTGVRIPPVAVIQPGKGVWIAQNPSEIENPWKLSIGSRYGFFDEMYKTMRYFDAVSRHGTLKLRLLPAVDFTDFDDRFDVFAEPYNFLTPKQWLTLVKINDEFKSEGLAFNEETVSSAVDRMADVYLEQRSMNEPSSGPTC